MMSAESPSRSRVLFSRYGLTTRHVNTMRSFEDWRQFFHQGHTGLLSLGIPRPHATVALCPVTGATVGGRDTVMELVSPCAEIPAESVLRMT